MALLLFVSGVLTPSGAAPASPEVVLVYHSIIPLGAETFAVDSWNRPFTVMASAVNADFEGWRQELVGARRSLLDAEGSPVRYYPDLVDFRVSVSTRLKLSEEPAPFRLHTQLAANDYMLKLRFQVKIFKGLHQTTVQPDSVTLIGVPADIPYDQRIYRIRFDLRQIPTSDRVVLEVLSPTGERICKFHLDLA